MISVSKMSAENVLAWVARKADIDFAVMDEAVYFAPSDEIRIARAAGFDFSARGRGADLVTFDFKDTTIRDAFAILSEKCGMKIILKSDVDDLPRITLAAKDMPVSSAIQAITAASGLNNAIIPEGSSYVVQLMKTAPAAVPAQAPAVAPVEPVQVEPVQPVQVEPVQPVVESSAPAADVNSPGVEAVPAPVEARVTLPADLTTVK